MGLDMYARTVKNEDILPPPDGTELSDVNFMIAPDSEGYAKAEEIQYWRKFNNLHGWFERLYREKGGTEEFNCTPVILTEADLARLENDAKNRSNLDPTEGFFFGSANPLDDESAEEILDFVAKARRYIADGYTVIYDSWW